MPPMRQRLRTEYPPVLESELQAGGNHDVHGTRARRHGYRWGREDSNVIDFSVFALTGILGLVAIIAALIYLNVRGR
jgi:hypothetical protein